MNVKRISKRTLATLLSVLLLLSTIVAGTVTTANATASWSSTATNNIYAYFDNSSAKLGVGSGKIRMIAVTDSNIYVSGGFSGVNNYSSLRYKNVYSDFAALGNWSNVRYVFFGEYKTGSESSGSFEYGSGKTYSDVSAFITDKIYGNKYTNNTGNDITISITNGNSLVFYPDNSELAVVNYGGSSAKDINAVQSASVPSGGGSVSGTYYSCNGAGSTTKSSNVEITADFDAMKRTSVTLTATPDSNYRFDGWYDNSSFTGSPVSTAATYTYTVDGAKTLYAKFSTGLTQTASAGEGGGRVSVSGGGTVSVSGGGNSDANIVVPSGTEVTYTAIPAANYKFDGWYRYSDFSGGVVSNNDPYTFTANSANTLYAKFTQIVNEADDPNNTNESTPSVKNTGSRHTKATSLSPQAVNYYTDEVKEYITDSNVYGTFVDLQDNNLSNGNGTSYDAMQNNDLFDTLYNIMSTTHTHAVSYPSYGKNSLAHYWLTTDTSYDNENDGRGVYTFFYEDVDCFNHEHMQREHIWPKSKASFLMKTGLGGSDLHHLRPAYGKVNNIKSNWGFGSIKTQTSETGYTYNSGWYNKRVVNWPSGTPSLWRADTKENGKTYTFIDVKDDIRGDVARILLYVYTRWKQPNLYSDITTTDDEGNIVPDTSRLPELDPDDSKDTGERIIQSKQVLLDWMKNDPVSEWEMQRNDYTQKIQGNRNVFIDYPELAWLLFDETPPSNMDTPSGMAKHTGSDIHANPTPSFTDGVELDFKGKLGNSNGEAEITAYDLTTQKEVRNGDMVERGDIITYTVIPDESTVTGITEFISDDDTHTGSDYRRTIASPNTDTTYSFTRQAGYYNDSPNTGYNKERIKVSLASKGCELNIKINSKTATGGSGGSGSGMVTARITGTNTVLENGAYVPNGTNVTFYFTPDYGSRFYGLTYVNAQTADNITGTDSYTYSTTLDCSGGSVRKKTFTVYFAQTFNAGNSDPERYKHINNKGMRPDEADQWGAETNFTENFEICGVQMKRDEQNLENKALRFVSVIDKNILNKAKSYGYVIGYTKKNLDKKAINRYAFSLVKGNDEYGKTIDCTGSSNDVFGDYGKNSADTNYKYITAAVNNIQDAGTIGLDTVIIARPYVELKDEYKAKNGPSVIYGQYVDVSTGEAYCSCSGSYNYIKSLADTQY